MSSLLRRLGEPIDVERFVDDLLANDDKGFSAALHLSASLLSDIVLAEEFGEDEVTWGRSRLGGDVYTYGRKPTK